MGGRALLIIIVGAIAVAGRTFLGITSSSGEMAGNAEMAFLRQSAKNIAQSGLNLGLRRLADDPSWRSGIARMHLFSGEVSVSAADTTFAGSPAVLVIAVAVMEAGTGLELKDTAAAFFKPPGFLPGAVKAAITANNNVSTLGTLIVDGRDHGPNGALIPGRGTLGIWTTGALSQGGNSRIGGFSGGTTSPPAKPADTVAYDDHQSYPGGYPGTPDSVMGGAPFGYPEGALKSLAQSGARGSQYSTSPSSLRYPLSGVTYVELPSGSSWESASIQGSGVLVVHNTARNAVMKNINAGTFTGLMIVDDPLHIHATIVGALVALTPSPSSGNCMGNGSGSILYSSQAIKNATGGSSSGSESAAGVLAWWE